MRESSGKKYLLDLGICGNNIYVTGDPAFGMRINKDEKLFASVVKITKLI